MLDRQRQGLGDEKQHPVAGARTGGAVGFGIVRGMLLSFDLGGPLLRVEQEKTAISRSVQFNAIHPGSDAGVRSRLGRGARSPLLGKCDGMYVWSPLRHEYAHPRVCQPLSIYPPNASFLGVRALSLPLVFAGDDRGARHHLPNTASRSGFRRPRVEHRRGQAAFRCDARPRAPLYIRTSYIRACIYLCVFSAPPCSLFKCHIAVAVCWSLPPPPRAGHAYCTVCHALHIHLFLVSDLA